MVSISKRAFLRTIWLLKDYLADIVIGGSWAPLIYCHYLLGDKTINPVRTFDIDLTVKNTVPVRGEMSVDQVLTSAGLSTEFKSFRDSFKPFYWLCQLLSVARRSPPSFAMVRSSLTHCFF